MFSGPAPGNKEIWHERPAGAGRCLILAFKLFQELSYFLELVDSVQVSFGEIMKVSQPLFVVFNQGRSISWSLNMET
jgi:hypothetical protein